jgi:hypothetical protein
LFSRNSGRKTASHFCWNCSGLSNGVTARIFRRIEGDSRGRHPPAEREKNMVQVAASFVWWLVIAGPQGGMVVMPNPFDSRDACQAAITEYQKNQPPKDWVLQCVPTADQTFE